MHPGQRALIIQINRELAIEQFEERAAIIEEATGCTRSEAEERARVSVANCRLTGEIAYRAKHPKLDDLDT